MNRRDLLKGLAAGGLIVAGELWIPGAKKIFIPSGMRFHTDSDRVTIVESYSQRNDGRWTHIITSPTAQKVEVVDIAPYYSRSGQIDFVEQTRIVTGLEYQHMMYSDLRALP